VIDIAVLYLPHISNFTDFAALEAIRGVGVRYVKEPYHLGKPDLVILPGTKNTVYDLLRLRETGLESAIKRLAENGTPILGICGGYQMLGEIIRDDEDAESGATIHGMGLLPVVTEFAAEKHRTRVTAKALEIEGVLSALGGADLIGYEIHMGVSTPRGDVKPLLKLSDGTYDGCQCGNVYGTYLHGFFDSEACRKAILGVLCKRKGVKLENASFDLKAHKERQYDKLADGVRTALNMALFYKILEAGI
jgi:adenosylcobyric acid synthase